VSGMAIGSKVLAIVDRKSGSMFALGYFIVTRVRGTNRSLQIPSHLLAVLRWCGWWVSTCRLDLKAGAKIQKTRAIDLRSGSVRLPISVLSNETKFLRSTRS
jgi:hypothetical protein